MPEMQLAITNHAVERYKLRVPNASKLEDNVVRRIIHKEVEEADADGRIKPHPGYPDRRMVSFTAGKENMFLALGPNNTGVPGEWAVIGVLFDRELGKNGIGATLGDAVSEEMKKQIADAITAPRTTQYLIRIGGAGSKEIYDARDDQELGDLLNRRHPRPEDVEIFERREAEVKTVYMVVPKK